MTSTHDPAVPVGAAHFSTVAPPVTTTAPLPTAPAAAPREGEREEHSVPAGDGHPYVIAYSLTRPPERRHAPAIVLCHGAWHTKACWEVRATRALAAHGWIVAALSYRAHSPSQGDVRALKRSGTREYAADVRAVVENLVSHGVIGDPSEAILVGHSMGGLVAAQYCSQWPAAGLLYVCSAASSLLTGGFFGLLVKMLRNPLHWASTLRLMLFTYSDPYAMVRASWRVRQLFLQYALPKSASREAVAAREAQLAAGMRFYRAYRQGESPKIFAEVQKLPKNRRPPCLARHVGFIGAEQDALVPRRFTYASAALYRPEYEPAVAMVDAPHCLMLAGDVEGAIGAIDRMASTWDEPDASSASGAHEEGARA